MTVYGHQRHGSLSKATHLSLTEALVCVAVDKKQGSLFSNFPTKGSSIMLGGTGIQHVYFLFLSSLLWRLNIKWVHGVTRESDTTERLSIHVYVHTYTHIYAYAYICIMAVIAHTGKVMLKILQAGFNSTWTGFKLDFKNTEELEIKLPTSIESLKKQESSRKISTSALLTMPKPLMV